jgi:hypothetical protein
LTSDPGASELPKPMATATPTLTATSMPEPTARATTAPAPAPKKPDGGLCSAVALPLVALAIASARRRE